MRRRARNPGLGDPQPTLFGGKERRFVPLTDLTHDQIVTLPIDAFSEEEWEELEGEEQNTIIANDPTAIVSALVRRDLWDGLDEDQQDLVIERDPVARERVAEMFATLKDRYGWVADPDDDQAFDLAGEGFEMFLSDHEDELADLAGDDADDVLDAYPQYDPADVQEALKEAMEDTNNYEFTIEDYDYHCSSFWCWELSQQSFYLNEEDLEKLAGPSAEGRPDETSFLGLAIRQFNEHSSDALSHDLTVEALEKASLQRYAEFDAHFDTGKAVIVTPDWEAIASDVADKMEGREPAHAGAFQPLGAEGFEGEERISHVFADKYFVKDLLADELRAEGAEMRMCVGRKDMGYADSVRAGDIKIFSLRRPDGKPRFTFEVALRDGVPHHIVQIKGKANRLPGWSSTRAGLGKFKEEEVARVVEFVELLGFDPWDVHDLRPALERWSGKPIKNAGSYRRVGEHCGFCCPVGRRKGK